MDVGEYPDYSSIASQSMRRWLNFAEVSGLLALVGAMGYLLGILVLWVPIVRNYTQDIVASWYSVSMVPKTIVVGHGLIRLLVPTLVYTLLIAVALSSYYVPALRSRKRGAAIRIAALSIVILISLIPLFVVLISGDEITLLVWALVLLAPVLISIPLAWVTFYLRRSLQHVEKRRRTVLTSITVVLASSFLLSFLIFVVAAPRPPLPRVELTGSQRVEGRLLAHAEGYWYILNVEGNVVAISDEVAKRATVSPMNFRK